MDFCRFQCETFSFACLFLAYKNVESFIFVILKNFAVPLLRKLNLCWSSNCRRLWNVPLEIEPWPRFRGQSRIPKKIFFSNVPDIAAVYGTPVSFSRNRSGSRIWRIHDPRNFDHQYGKKKKAIERAETNTWKAEFKPKSFAGLRYYARI